MYISECTKAAVEDWMVKYQVRYRGDGYNALIELLASPSTGEGQQQDEPAAYVVDTDADESIIRPALPVGTQVYTRASLSSPSERHEAEEPSESAMRNALREVVGLFSDGIDPRLDAALNNARHILAAPSSPSVEIGTDFSQASVDTPEFWQVMDAWRFAGPGIAALDAAEVVIAHIDQHTAQAVKAAREEALNDAENEIAALHCTHNDYDHLLLAFNAVRALRTSHASETTPQPSVDSKEGEKG